MRMKPFLAWLIPLCLTSCLPLETGWTLPAAKDSRIVLQGYLHAADSVHRIWGAYARSDGAVEAADLPMEIRVNGQDVAVTAPEPSPFPDLLPALYVFEARLQEGDRIRVKAGDASAEATVLPPPDTVSVTMSERPAGENGSRTLSFTVQLKGSGYYRMELLPENRWFSADGRLLRVSYPEGPSVLFSMEAGTVGKTLSMPGPQRADMETLPDAAKMECRVMVRVLSLSRDRFAWYNAWDSDRTDGFFSGFADPVRFPGNVAGGTGLVDIAGETGRTFPVGTFSK